LKFKVWTFDWTKIILNFWQKISILTKKNDFWQKIVILTKNRIIIYFIKIPYVTIWLRLDFSSQMKFVFVREWTFWNFSSKMKLFVKKRNFSSKIKFYFKNKLFLSKINVFGKNRYVKSKFTLDVLSKKFSKKNQNFSAKMYFFVTILFFTMSNIFKIIF